jgi:hypothetical protein
MDTLHARMTAQRYLAADDSAISRILDYILKRWAVLSHNLDDGAVPYDNYGWSPGQSCHAQRLLACAHAFTALINKTPFAHGIEVTRHHLFP